MQRLWLPAFLVVLAVSMWAYAGAEFVRSVAALAMVYGVGYVSGSLLVDPKHAGLSLAIVRLVAGGLLTSIVFLLSIELSLPWFSGPLALCAIAVIRHRLAALLPPEVRVTPSRGAVAAGLVAVVLLAPPVVAALRMAPGTFPPVYFHVDVPYFLEQVHALVKADAFPPDSLSVVDGRRPYHFGLHALAAVISRGTGIAPHHAVFMILVPLLTAGILAAAAILARALAPRMPSVVAIGLLLLPSPTLWYDFSRVLVTTVQNAFANQSVGGFKALGLNWEIWGVSPNIQNLGAHFIVLAGLAAVVNAVTLGWRLALFLVGSAFVFKSPLGVALLAGFAVACSCRAVMEKSLRPLIPIAGAAAVFGVVYGAFWMMSPIPGELRVVVRPLFHFEYLKANGGPRWFVYDVVWLLLPVLTGLLARRKDPDTHSLPLLGFVVAPLIVVNVLRLVDLREDMGISSMNAADWRQIIMPIPVLMHVWVLSVIGRRWLHLGTALRAALVIIVMAAVIPGVTMAARYADVLLEDPDAGHEFADNRDIAEALAVIPTTNTIVVTNDLRYPADGFRRQNLQMQIPSLFGHQAFAVNYMYEAYPFSDGRRALQRLLQAEQWTPAVDEAARTHRWTHLLIRKDHPHPTPIPLEQIFDGAVYSVFRFKTG